MKVLVWECQCCYKRSCLTQFYGLGPYKRPDFCIRDVTILTDPWKLVKIEESDIVKYFVEGNEECVNQNDTR
jgi:hypothetical protein